MTLKELRMWHWKQSQLNRAEELKCKERLDNEPAMYAGARLVLLDTARDWYTRANFHISACQALNDILPGCGEYDCAEAALEHLPHDIHIDPVAAFSTQLAMRASIKKFGTIHEAEDGTINFEGFNVDYDNGTAEQPTDRECGELIIRLAAERLLDLHHTLFPDAQKAAYPDRTPGTWRIDIPDATSKYTFVVRNITYYSSTIRTLPNSFPIKLDYDSQHLDALGKLQRYTPAEVHDGGAGLAKSKTGAAVLYADVCALLRPKV